MKNFDRLSEICWDRLKKLDLVDEKHANRLREELSEIKKKDTDEAEYFLRFYDQKLTVDKNEHNLIICYLLGICPLFNIDKSAAYTECELPDVDVDYHPLIRDYLKDEFSFNKYGKDYVSNIVSYQTYDIKSSLIDIAKTLGKDRNEILHITTQLTKMKDEDGDDLTFESMEEDFKAIEQKIIERKGLTKLEQIMVLLNDYRKANPQVWDVAKHLVAAPLDWKKFNYGKPPRRKKNMSMHASGLIIAGVKLSEFVPLVTPPGSRDKGLQATAWVEGLADTDCSSIGLVKFDYLSLEANAKVAECNRLIMERHGLKSICALPGLSNWSDTSYLNDPKALEMANTGDLKGIFQFDSNGIRKLCKKCGINSFDDLVAVTALYRPGPMDAGMHDEYCDRKHGKVQYDRHPLLESVLGKTYYVMNYQEQVMKVLNIVGDIPLKDCEAARKAISKKKQDKIDKLKDVFIQNGSNKFDRQYVEELFSQIVTWAGYGFNASHATAYTVISSRQLWQKAHYPLEFFTSALRSLKTGDKRLPIYIQDARKKSIVVNKLDLNKSKEDFEIINNEIYYGFGKVKGVGQEASKIVKLQPYKNFQDFLNRFGTEAKVVQPLIGLKVFNERDPHTLYLYYEFYKKGVKSEETRYKSNGKTVNKHLVSLLDLTGKDWEYGFDDSYFGQLQGRLEHKDWLKACALKKKFDKCVNNFAKKTEIKKSSPKLSIESFVPPSASNRTFVLNKVAYKTYKSMKPILKDPSGIVAEEAFYGFPWKNEFEQLPLYKGMTFDDFEIDILNIESGTSLPVEVKIVSKEHVASKSGKVWYWRLRVSDSLEPDVLRSVVVWDHDYNRFESSLQVGNIVRLRLFPPEHPYPNYSLEGVKPWELRGNNPYGDDPQFDYRVLLLGVGSKKEDFVDDEDDSYLVSSPKKKKDDMEELLGFMVEDDNE